MSASLSIARTDIFAAVRAFIMGVITGVEVVDGLDNGVPMPIAPFIAITPLFNVRLGTNTMDYNDPTPTTGTENIQSHRQYTIQVDFYGPQSSDWASIIETLWRSDYACGVLAPLTQPLYADEPKQISIVDGEQNFQERWLITLNLQYNPTVQVPMQFFTTATVLPVNVNVAYPS